MKETVYCPRCAKSNVKTIVGETGGLRDENADVLITSGDPMYGMFWSRRKSRRFVQYMPVYHQCENCGHVFLSQETNLEELRRSVLNRNAAIRAAVIWGALGIGLIVGGSMGETAVALFGICAVAVAVLGVINAVNSSKVIPELRKQLKELQKVQQKYKAMFY